MTDEKFQEYMLHKIDQVHKDLIAIKVELATLRGRASVWGALGGLLITGALALFFK